MKNLFLLLFILYSSIFCSQINKYRAIIINENNQPVPYVKLKAKDYLFNSDSLGAINGNLSKGDTLYVVDYNYQKSLHIVKGNIEKIMIKEKFFEIEPIILSQNDIQKKFSVTKSKINSFYSIQYDREYAFLNYTDKKIVFNRISIPIKNFNDKKEVYNENTKFSIQFYDIKNGLPNEPITKLIFFNSNKNLKNIKLKLLEKFIIPKGDFFIVLKAYETSSKIFDKSIYRFNPFFLCNMDGKSGSYLEYKYKEEKWKIIDKERNKFIFNLNFDLWYE